MSSKNRWVGLTIFLLTLSAAILPLTPGAWAQNSYKTLYKFTGGKDGSQPVAGLVWDAARNLYGTTCCGGNSTQGDGTVFKLMPNSDGGWTESVLYSFSGGNDGAVPLAGVIFDANGSLYGTAANGGNNNLGVVYKLTFSHSLWTETVLHSFKGGSRTALTPLAVLYSTHPAHCTVRPPREERMDLAWFSSSRGSLMGGGRKTSCITSRVGMVRTHLRE
jgi:uncharacterized repeat protein (TIGR03803 family)